MDKSFEGLLISLLIHFALAMFFIYAKLPPPNDTRPTQITLIEKEARPPHKGKYGYIENDIPKPQTKQEPVQDPDFLSQFTQKVKKQYQAKNIAAETRNRQGKGKKGSQANRAAGLTQNTDRGDLQLGERERMIATPQLDESTIHTYIPGVESFEFNLLNTGQDVYAAFFNRNNPQVINRWILAMQGYVALLTPQLRDELGRQNRMTAVDAVLTPQGQILRIDILRSSGDKGFDEVAVQAFRKAAPFNHPPSGLVDGDGLIHYRGAFTVYFKPPSFGLGGNG